MKMPTIESKFARKYGKFASAASIAAGLILLLARFAEWWIADFATPFGAFALESLVWIIFAACLITFVVRAVRDRFRRGTWIPVVVSSLALIASLSLPLLQWWIKLNFAVHRDARHRVVADVVAGKLHPNVLHNPKLIALGEVYPHVSAGGNEIVVETHGGRDYIFFYAYRGILDSYAGFLFVPEGGDPRTVSDASGSQIRQLSTEWYYLAHY